MANRVSITKQVHDPLEVDLLADDGGAVFETRPRTKDIVDQLGPIDDRLRKYADLSADEQFELVCDYLDLVLKPQNGATRKKPSDIIRKAWNEGKLDSEQVAFVFDAVLGGKAPEDPR